jgi:hypothetical protein
MERVPKARDRDREKVLADATPEAVTPRNKAVAVSVAAASRAREPARVPAVVRAEVKAAEGMHNKFTSQLFF